MILEEYWPLVFLVWGLRYSIDMYTAMPMAKIFMFLSCIWLIRYMYCYLLFLERQVDNSGVSFFPTHCHVFSSFSTAYVNTDAKGL